MRAISWLLDRLHAFFDPGLEQEKLKRSRNLSSDPPALQQLKALLRHFNASPERTKREVDAYWQRRRERERADARWRARIR